jgi:hypothetical protein
MATKCPNCTKAHRVEMVKREHYSVCFVASAISAYNEKMRSEGRPPLTQDDCDRIMRRLNVDALLALVGLALGLLKEEQS